VKNKQKHLNEGWLRKWVTGEPHVILHQNGQPYLIRRYVVPRNNYLNVYLHKFVRSDYDEALHDHPWWFISMILKGQYVEHQLAGKMSHRQAGSIAFRKATTMHRVELFYQDNQWKLGEGYTPVPVWTLVITGRRVREWGFACPKGWCPWKEFTGGTYSQAVGCGEYS
jgi:hypothetical protein